MTSVQIKSAALAIFNMRVNRYTKQSQSDNQRRIDVRKRIEERRFNAMLDDLRDEVAA